MSKFFKALEEADRERLLRQQAQQPGGNASEPGANPPAPPRLEPALLVDEIRKMAASPFQLVDRFIEEARKITTDEQVAPAAAMEKFKQLQQRLVRETEDRLKTFRRKVSQKEQELQAILHPGEEDTARQALRAVRQLERAIERLTLKDRLSRRWEDQSAPALLAEYRKALRVREKDTIEIFEAEAERFLARKGDPQAVSDFVTLRTQSQESRLTTTQREARTALDELKRIKEEAKITLCFLAYTFPAYGGLIPLSALWRKEERHSLDQVDQRGISLTIRKDGKASLLVTLVEFSKSGLKVQASEKFAVGAILDLSLALSGATQEAISFTGKVRWCREEPTQQGQYALGLQLVEAPEGRWMQLFPKLLNQVTELDDLFSSLGG